MRLSFNVFRKSLTRDTTKTDCTKLYTNNQEIRLIFPLRFVDHI